MIVKEQHVAAVVKEVSAGAEDPQHVASLVGAFMQIQPTVGHYVSAHSNELGLEGVVLTLLHAVGAGARRRAGARPAAARGALRGSRQRGQRGATRRALADDEPELAGYLEGNLDPKDPTLGGGKRDVALRVLAVVARAYLEQR